jgi:hypothetical protein
MSSTLWFAGDALVNDRREFWGQDTIRAWLDREIIGDKVTTNPPPPPPPPPSITAR